MTTSGLTNALISIIPFVDNGGCLVPTEDRAAMMNTLKLGELMVGGKPERKYMMELCVEQIKVMRTMAT